MDALDGAQQYAALAKIPVGEVVKTFKLWRNVSNFTDYELALYVEYFYHYQYSSLAEVWAEGFIFFVFGILGLIGFVLEVVVLKHCEFETASFSYHKTIVAIELLTMPFLIEIGITNWIPTIVTSFLTSFVTNNVCRTVHKISIMAADYVTFFMSIERVLALWSPITLFPYINAKPVAMVFCLLSIAFGLTYVTDFYKYDVLVNAAGAVKVNSRFAETKGYVDFNTIRNVIQLVKGYGAIGLSLVVIIGVLQHSRRRGAKPAKAADRQLARRNLQLCLLCLSCSVPVAINTTLFVIFSEYLVKFTIGQKAVTLLPFDEATANARKGIASLVDLFLANLAYCIAHCCHFYFYLWLHPTFRRITRETLHLNNKAPQAINDGPSASSSRRSSVVAPLGTPSFRRMSVVSIA